ncbi:ataxin-1-like [Paramacrobiotus metropolitanus]|uniref:ataxin-1-like n=1 Tax=Paramacrobiotus metropolitanus TaxID=2943436 RepID=UPI002445DF99|nr:ataxin-1-like [Paramacrobiotus metropolitanus]
MSGGSGSEMSTPCVSPKGPASPSPNKFCPGSLIQLANGQLKAVENMTVEDFELSAALSSSLRVEYSIVSRIEKSPLGHLRAEKKEDADVVIYFRVGHLSAEVAVEATTAHPFFVVGKGWSSAAPASTLTRFGLKVALLVAGDTCISLACRDASQSSRNVTDENTLAAASASSAVRGPAGVASAPSRPEATKVDARTTFPFQYGPAPGTGEPPPAPASSHSGVPPLLFTATESELASFRRWSAPEDDRLLETFLAHHSHIPK